MYRSESLRYKDRRGLVIFPSDVVVFCKARLVYMNTRLEGRRAHVAHSCAEERAAKAALLYADTERRIAKSLRPWYKMLEAQFFARIQKGVEQQPSRLSQDSTKKNIV